MVIYTIVMLEKESAYFQSKFQELLSTDLGKFVVIKDEKIYGTYVAMQDALKYGYETFLDEPFFIRQVVPDQYPLDFTNNHLLV